MSIRPWWQFDNNQLCAKCLKCVYGGGSSFFLSLSAHRPWICRLGEQHLLQVFAGNSTATFAAWIQNIFQTYFKKDSLIYFTFPKYYSWIKFVWIVHPCWKIFFMILWNNNHYYRLKYLVIWVVQNILMINMIIISFSYEKNR